MFSLLRTAGNSGTNNGLRGFVLNRCQLSTSAYAMSKIIYTECDEAPMLATFSLLPVIQRFAKPMGIEVSFQKGSLGQITIFVESFLCLIFLEVRFYHALVFHVAVSRMHL